MTQAETPKSLVTHKPPNSRKSRRNHNQSGYRVNKGFITHLPVKYKSRISLVPNGNRIKGIIKHTSEYDVATKSLNLYCNETQYYFSAFNHIAPIKALAD